MYGECIRDAHDFSEAAEWMAEWYLTDLLGSRWSLSAEDVEAIGEAFFDALHECWRERGEREAHALGS